jgi:hypothetical protein
MTPSSRALLNGLIDYAGLFPPARLAMPAAAAAYCEHRASPCAWMLGRFICPANRLGELEEQLDLLVPAGTAPLRVSLLGGGGDDADVFLRGLDGELKVACEFIDRAAGRVVIDVIETRWPAALLASCDAAETHTLAGMAAERIAAVANRLNRASGAPSGRAHPGTVRPFFEAALTEAWRSEIPEFVLGLADHNGGAIASACESVGLKLRTGGVEARMFPSSEQVAFVLAECRRHGLAFKATAGLHHPIRHHNDSVAARMHGFLNLFGGAVLLFAAAAPGGREFGEADLREMLDDESADSFSFDADSISWRDHRAGVDDIALARSQFALSFGSCSFDEPVDDLQKLGVLTGAGTTESLLGRLADPAETLPGRLADPANRPERRVQ